MRNRGDYLGSVARPIARRMRPRP